MSMGRGLLVSIIIAAIGAGAWVAIAHFTGMSLGILAILVGLGAGIGMALGLKGRGGVTAGFTAAVVAFVGIVGAKYTQAHLQSAAAVVEAAAATEDDALIAIAETIQTRWEGEGVELSEPDGDSPFPYEVWDAARRQWAEMSDPDKEQMLASMAAENSTDVREAQGALTILFMILSLSPSNLILIGLTLSAAWKLGSHRAAQPEAVAAPEESRPAPTFGGIRMGPEVAAVPPVQPAAVAPNPARPTANPSILTPISVNGDEAAQRGAA